MPWDFERAATGRHYPPSLIFVPVTLFLAPDSAILVASDLGLRLNFRQMATLSFVLGLITALVLTFLPCTNAVDITDLFTVQPGARDGGCNGREAMLDQWLSEGIESVHIALAAILTNTIKT